MGNIYSRCGIQMKLGLLSNLDIVTSASRNLDAQSHLLPCCALPRGMLRRRTTELTAAFIAASGWLLSSPLRARFRNYMYARLSGPQHGRQWTKLILVCGLKLTLNTSSYWVSILHLVNRLLHVGGLRAALAAQAPAVQALLALKEHHRGRLAGRRLHWGPRRHADACT